jgi:hypothetical protein
MEEITNYFVCRQTSGAVEGFNNKVRVPKRRRYGSQIRRACSNFYFSISKAIASLDYETQDVGRTTLVLEEPPFLNPTPRSLSKERANKSPLKSAEQRRNGNHRAITA